MAFLHEDDRKTLHKEFERMDRPVRLLVFTDPDNCQYCKQTRQLVEELAELDGRIELEIVDRIAEPELAARYAIDKAPAIAILTNGVEPRDTGIRFYGIPSGYEFTTLVDDIVTVSRDEPGLAGPTLDWLGKLTQPVHLQVFVTPTCPYCPRAVQLAHHLALASPLVQADMVEATEFPELSERYQVYGVPRTVINDSVAIEGAVPEGHLLQQMKQAVAQTATSA